jgi:glycosyltransferase involved in cell wall biosynthesis
MKIVDVNPFFYPLLGGIEHRMHATCKLLAAKGHDVTVLTGRLPGTAEEERTVDGYRILRLRSKFINIYNPPYISSKGVAEALDALDADIVNYNYRWAPSYNRPMFAYGGKKVFTYHNMWGEGMGIQAKLSEMNDGRFRKGLETFDHIICVSDHVRNDLIRRGIRKEMTTTVCSGLDSMPKIGENEGDFILSLGRLVRTKGLDHLMKAMIDVPHKLIICGKGPDAARIQRLIKRYGIGDRVEMRGWVSEEEKDRLMSMCKFFVMPSLFESYGLAAVELMSYGRPLVCTNVNGLPDTVGDGAVIVGPKDPAGLADAMNSLIGDREKRERLGKNARAKAEGYDWKYLLGGIEDVYRKVIDGTYSNATE